MANDFTDPSGRVGKELGGLRKELEALRKTQAAQAAEQERANRAAGKGDSAADRRGRERSVRGKATPTTAAESTAAAKATEKQVFAVDDLAKRQDRLNRIETQSRAALRTEIQQRALASQALRKHGALTTEFISAAAAGNVTLREMRFQLGATIAKFAGWTLAAGFTFAAINALTKLGQGAINGAEGVNQLSRVINNFDASNASAQISELANASNNDLATVGDAFFESGKRFQNQDDAKELTRVALRAKNVGELEVGDAVNFLTSVVRGFKLEAGDAADVLDIFNNLQQNFGTDIRGGLAGAAKAAAAQLNAGGSLRQTAALLATMQRAGFTGDEGGVALRRSAELIKRPGGINRERLAAFGIDSNDPLKNIYNQAIKLAESGRVRGPQINELGTALSTPQLSARFAALLNRPDQYRRAFNIAGPDSKDSAVKEENKFLNSARQQIKAVGVEVERLGEALRQAGAFQVLAGFVKALNTGLDAATAIVEVFNQIPGPLRQALVIFAQMYGLLRLIKRFNPSDGASKGRFGGFFQPNDQQQMKRLLRTSSRGEVSFFRDLQERSINDTANQRVRAIEAQSAAQATRSQYGIAAQNGDANAARAVRQADERAFRETQLATQAKERYVLANQGLTTSLARESELNRRLAKPGANAANVAKSVGIQTVPPTANIPTSRQPVPVAQMQQTLKGFGYRDEEIKRQTAALQAESQTVRQRLGQAAKTGTLFQRSLAVVAVGVDATREGIKGIPSKAKGLEGKMVSAQGTMSRAGASLRGLFGGFELAVLGLIAIGDIIFEKSQEAALGAQIDSALVKARKGKLKVDQAKSLLEQAKAPRGPFNFIFDEAKRGLDATLSGQDPTGVSSPRDERITDAEEAVRIAKREDRQRRERKRRERALQLQARSLNGSNRFNAVAFDNSALLDEIDALSTLSDIQGLGGKGIRDLAAAYVEARRRFAGRRSPEAIQSLAQAQQGFEGAVQSIQTNLERELKLSSDPRDQRAAYNKARGEVQKIKNAAQRQIAVRRRALAAAQRNQKQLERQQQDASSIPDVFVAPGADPTKLTTGALNRGKRQTRDAKKKLTQAEKALKAINNFLREFLRDLAEAFSGAQDDALSGFDEETDRINQIAEVNASGTQNHGSQLAIRMGAANENLRRAQTLGGKEGARRVRDALIERNNILNEMADLAVQQLEAAGQVTIASAPTEQGRIRAEIGVAQQKLSLLKSQGRGPEETNLVIADLIRLKKELNRQILDDANNLAEAAAEYRKSLTGDPLKEAKIDERTAQKLLANAKKIEDPTERRIAVLRARARRNDARGQRQLTGFQQAYDTIRFKSDIGLIGTDQEQAQIERLLAQIPRRLIRSVDGLRDFVRNLRSRLHELEEESRDDINIGSLRLPTIYDVRRLARQGTETAPNGVVNQVNNYQFTTSSVGEAEAIGSSLGDVHKTNTRAAMRAAGLRG